MCQGLNRIVSSPEVNSPPQFALLEDISGDEDGFDNFDSVDEGPQTSNAAVNSFSTQARRLSARDFVLIRHSMESSSKALTEFETGP